MAKTVTAYDLAARFIGLKETPGVASNPQVLAMLRVDDAWPTGDDVPWCSAFVNYVCWLLDLPRSKKLNARSWLTVGQAVPLSEAQRGDVVVLSRGSNPAQGHVGFFDHVDRYGIWLLGGNQSDAVNVSAFPTSRLLGVCRLG